VEIALKKKDLSSGKSKRLKSEHGNLNFTKVYLEGFINSLEAE
jgi:hypothetical protein